MSEKALRALPSVDKILNCEDLKDDLAGYDPEFIKYIIRTALDELRGAILRGEAENLTLEKITGFIKERLRLIAGSSLRRVVNASGIILHTNLGRAILPIEAVEAIRLAASNPVDLEFDLGSGFRGERDARIEVLLGFLAGAEAACVVNNNAAAVLLTLNTLAEGKEVVVSRGELIEIGGSFRLPEIIKKSGCVMKEVGATNRTHPEDYLSAITPDTAVLFKAHKSNYTIEGFTSEVDIKELSVMGKARHIPVVEDLGSGALIDLSRFGLKKEPVVRERISGGADIVTFSGDKLLGGPQAGLIAGKKELVERIRKNPLKRALRADKMTIAALEATLRLYLKPDALAGKIPAFEYISRPLKEIEKAANQAKKLLEKRLGVAYVITVEDSESIVGSGALPDCVIPTKVVSVTHPSEKPEKIFKMFLSNDPPILGRVAKDRFLLDLRTVDKAGDVCP
ncbi:MAG TPA: L-seryl-tRNA(Sec) selenium transferase [Thermodesulfobacteriota bacterium]|nr:L-seryl-tRNA(Sec) selenium transferase [Thermodesulfobacteriota bacterium]